MHKCKCGNQVASNARFCPHCGKRFTHPFVRALAGLSVLFIGGAFFYALSGPGPVPAPKPAAPAASSPAAGKAVQKKPAVADQEQGRKTYAELVDTTLLDSGIESRTVATGPAHSTLIIHDALAGRVRARAVSNLVDAARGFGFKKLVYTNDYETTFVWDLTKKD